MAEISFFIISMEGYFVKENFCFFRGIFGNTFPEVIRMKIMKQAALFSVGGGAYVGLELLYRGYSHISMFTAGGVCFLLIGGISRLPVSRLWQLGCGAGAITAVELVTGLLVNRQFQVWDYRNQPGNFLGQICPLFMLLWIPVTAAGMGLYRWADAGLDRLAVRRCRTDA